MAGIRDKQNVVALAASEMLRITTVGGNVAHFPASNWCMTCATASERDVTNRRRTVYGVALRTCHSLPVPARG